jgi:hypothetical protein
LRRRGASGSLRALLLAGALFLTLTSTGASAEKPSIGFPPSPTVDVHGAFAPRKLPAEGERAPASLYFKVRIGSSDEGQPPVLHELTMDLDRKLLIDPSGPACPAGHSDELAIAERCKSAEIGGGEVETEVALPGEAPVVQRIKLLAFNLGVKRGKPTILLQGEVAGGTPASFVVRGVISKVPNGVYGTSLTMAIPQLAGGHGSVRSISFKLHRAVSARGDKRSYLLARCSRGRLALRATLGFVDGTLIRGTLLRPCTGVPARS